MFEVFQKALRIDQSASTFSQSDILASGESCAASMILRIHMSSESREIYQILRILNITVFKKITSRWGELKGVFGIF